MASARTTSAAADRFGIPWSAFGVITAWVLLGGAVMTTLMAIAWEARPLVDTVRIEFPKLEQRVTNHIDQRSSLHRAAHRDDATLTAPSPAANNNQPGNGSDRAVHSPGRTATPEVSAGPQSAELTAFEQRRGLRARIKVWVDETPAFRLPVLARQLGRGAKTDTWVEIEQTIANTPVQNLRSIVEGLGID